jgi:hypothetical protein
MADVLTGLSKLIQAADVEIHKRGGTVASGAAGAATETMVGKHGEILDPTKARAPSVRRPQCPNPSPSLHLDSCKCRVCDLTWVCHAVAGCGRDDLVCQSRVVCAHTVGSG